MTTVTDALLPCPFCGGEAVLAGTSTPGVNTVRCKACGCAAGFGTDAEAIAGWNRRAIAAAVEIAKLREALEPFAAWSAEAAQMIETITSAGGTVHPIITQIAERGALARAALETDNG